MRGVVDVDALFALSYGLYLVTSCCRIASGDLGGKQGAEDAR